MSGVGLKGPWKVSPYPFIVVDVSGANVADCEVSHHLSDEEKLANARLISAAPDLLEAVIEMYESARANDNSTPSVRSFLLASEAISKAGGHVV